jgi:hypothetical protein
MLYYGFPHTVAPLAMLRFPAHSGPFCTMWFRQSTQKVTQMGHIDRSHPHSTEHDTQPIAYLISKQAILYRTCGGTCYPRGSTPKIRSLPDSSMTNHITWRNPTVSTIPTLLKPQHWSSPWSNDISVDGDHHSQRHKLNSTSQSMERLVWHSWLQMCILERATVKKMLLVAMNMWA